MRSPIQEQLVRDAEALVSTFNDHTQSIQARTDVQLKLITIKLLAMIVTIFTER